MENLNLRESHNNGDQESNLSFKESADRWNETTLGNLRSQSEKNGACVRQENISQAGRIYQNGGLGSTAGQEKSGQFNGANDFDDDDDDDAIRLANGDGAAEKKPLINNKSSRQRVLLCEKTNFYIYLSHFLSAWGDNMWTFAVGVFLVEIDGDSLQLTASFGLTMGVSTLLLGPIIGDWVDTMPRLRAAQEALVLQNVMIALCAGFVFNLLQFGPEIEGWGPWAPIAHYVLIIVLGTAAFLAHIANTISVERDWVVEICAGCEDRLASMTATMRAIDLTAMIVAPIATGQIMTAASSKTGALFIAGWNLVSFFVEYTLLLKVYYSVPALQKDKPVPGEVAEEDAVVPRRKSELVESMGQSRAVMTTSGRTQRAQGEVKVAAERTEVGHGGTSDQPKRSQEHNSCMKRLQRMFSGITIIAEGWKTYVRYPVMLSGLSLALLYMTVLGFDNVTIGYAKMQCLSEFDVGLMMGGAGVVGTLGTFAYPVMRRWLGLPWTGMVALTLQSATLSMCVVSVWLPGSPFDLDNPDNLGMLCQGNSTSGPASPTQAPDVAGPTTGVEKNMTSVWVLMAGIIAARFGLWIADLAITQMFLETVIESERGVVNGVQQSLNQFLDLIKFALVIVLPKTTQFGLLVILSYAFVVSGWLLYLVYLVRVPRSIFMKKIEIEV
ncbi:hypothetical protein BsWGS_04064 [Bradybaena similaris]